MASTAVTPTLSAKSVLLQALLPCEGYGLDLIERVKERTSGAMVLKQGTIYPALRSLEKDGLVESYESDPIPERGGRPRIYYALTAPGRRVALEERKTFAYIAGLYSGSGEDHDIDEDMEEALAMAC